MNAEFAVTAYLMSILLRVKNFIKIPKAIFVALIAIPVLTMNTMEILISMVYFSMPSTLRSLEGDIITVDDHDQSIFVIEYNWRLYRFCSRNFIQPITKMVGGAFALVPQSVVVLSPALQLIYSHNTCLFILHHEIGHIVNKHFTTIPWWKLLLIGFNRKRLISKSQVQKEELEADEYAASKLGKDVVIEGLKEMYGWQLRHDNYKTTITTKEFALRIAHLENM